MNRLFNRYIILFFSIAVIACIVFSFFHNRRIPVATATLETIASNKVAGTDVFRLLDNYLVYVVDFADLQKQANALNRIAIYTESRDNNGHVLSEKQMADYFNSKGKNPEAYYHGHDYSAHNLAGFFNAMQEQQIAMNADERYILRILTENEIIRNKDGKYEPVAPGKVLISISKSREGSAKHLNSELRLSTLRHEASHAEYFTKPEYKKYCEAYWNSLTPAARKIFSAELGNLGYNNLNRDLMINEMQAFLWEPLKGFFIDMSLKKENLSLAMLRQQFLEGIDKSKPKITAFFSSNFTRAVTPVTKSWGPLKKEA